MEILVALTIGSLFSAGVFLALRPHALPIILGLALISHGVNILLVAMGRVRLGRSPILSVTPEAPADPLAQALVLTASVISFGMTAFLLVLAYRTYQSTGSEGVDLPPAGDGRGEVRQ